jgi:hypothetical protein
MKQDFDFLEQIQKVEAPPFLLTRIMAKIEQYPSLSISKKEAMAWLISCIVLIAINLSIVFYTDKKENDTRQLAPIAEIMDMNTNNNLY